MSYSYDSDTSGCNGNATEMLEDVGFIDSTERAILIEFDDGSTDGPEIGVNRFWVPKSVIIDRDLIEFNEPGDIADAEVKSWWYEQCEGLEDAAS